MPLPFGPRITAAVLPSLWIAASPPAFAQIDSIDLIFEGGYRFGEEDVIDFEDPGGRIAPTGTGDGYDGAFGIAVGGEGWTGLFRAGYFTSSEDAIGSDVTSFGIFGDVTTVETLDHSLSGRTIDLLGGTDFMLGETTLTVLGGLRYARIEHGVYGEATSTGGLLDSVTVADDSVTFTGIGPRIEAALHTPLTEDIALVAGVGGTLFRGDTEIVRRFGFSIGGDPFSFGEDRFNEHRTVYQLDGRIGVEIGLDAIVGETDATLVAGYRLDAWWNTYNFRSVTPLAPLTDDRLWQHGPFVQLTIPLM